MKKVFLGLDLGIASVGWSLVDEEQNVIARGSHLFKQLSTSNDKKEYGEKIRGINRRSRRNLNRKKQRKIDFINTIDKYGYTNIIKPNKISKLYKEEYQKLFGFSYKLSADDFLATQAHKYNFYNIYKKALNEKIDKKELFLFLYQKLSNRGAWHIPFNYEEDFNIEKSLFKTYIEPKFKNIKIRSKENKDKSFSIYQNWYDIQRVLKINEMPLSFIEDYKKIFLRHRDFSQGPGNRISQTSSKPSEWGIQYDSVGNPKYKNLWDSKIGDCVISKAKHKPEKRWNNYYFLPEVVNFISQWSCVTKNNSQHKEYISKLEITKLLNYFILEDKTCTKTKIKDILTIDGNDLRGVPLSKDKISWNFDELKKIRNYFNKKKPIIIFNDKCIKPIDILLDLLVLDEIRLGLMIGDKTQNIAPYYIQEGDYKNIDLNKCKILAKGIIENSIRDRKLKLNSLYEINYDNFCDFSSFNDKDFSSTYRFGKSSYLEYMNEVFYSAENNSKVKSFNQHFSKLIRIGNKMLYEFDEKSIYLSKNLMKNQDFISPNALNTIKESIVIINKILNNYIFVNKNEYILDTIILETTWKNNVDESLKSERQRKEIVDYQKLMKEKKEEAEKICKEHEIEPSKNNIKKIQLLKEQDWRDAYNPNISLRGEGYISKEKIGDLEIDHIIPESISFDSKWENLVVTKSDNNLKKGKNLLPRQLNNYNDEWKNWWKSWYEINEKNEGSRNKKQNSSKDKIYKEILMRKYNNLTKETLETHDLLFFPRNLSETTYSISKLKESLTNYISFLNENYLYKEGTKHDKRFDKIKNTKILTLSSFTSQIIRKKLFSINDNEKKDRNDKQHHSQDATFCAWYASFDFVRKFYVSLNKFKNSYFSNQFTWDEYIIEMKKYKKIPTKKNIENYVEEHKNHLLEKLNNSECIFSYKNSKSRIKKVCKSISNISEEKLSQKINFIKPKKIFSNVNFETYLIDNDKKHQKVKYRLIGGTPTDNKNINNLFLSLHKYLINNSLEVNIDNVKLWMNIDDHFAEYKYDQKILTSPNIIFDLYKMIICNLSEEELMTIINYDNKRLEREFIFQKVNKNFIENHNELILSNKFNGIDINFDNIKNEYAIVYKHNNKLNLVKFITCLLSKEYKPTIDFSNIQKKSILNDKYVKNLNIRKCLYGEETNLITLIKYYDNKNNMKCDFFKINYLGDIVRKPSKIIEIVSVIPNGLIIPIYKDEKIFDFYEIKGVDIDPKSKKIEIASILNPSDKLIRKSYSSLKKDSINDFKLKSVLNYLKLN